MRRLSFILILFISVSARAQFTDQAWASLPHFKEGSKLMMEGFEFSMDKDTAAARRAYQKAIRSFRAAFKTDTSNIRLAVYLPDLYFYTGKYDSALYWHGRTFPADSAMERSAPQRFLASSYNFVGRCYLMMGELANAEKYFRKALVELPSELYVIGPTIWDVANSLRSDYTGSVTLKNMDPCKYAIDIIMLGLKLSGSDKYFSEFIFAPDRIAMIRKQCH